MCDNGLLIWCEQGTLMGGAFLRKVDAMKKKLLFMAAALVFSAYTPSAHGLWAGCYILCESSYNFCLQRATGGGSDTCCSGAIAICEVKYDTCMMGCEPY